MNSVVLRISVVFRQLPARQLRFSGSIEAEFSGADSHGTVVPPSPYGLRSVAFGFHRPSYICRRASYGRGDRSYGADRASYGLVDTSYGAGRASYGLRVASYPCERAENAVFTQNGPVSG